MTEQQLIYEMTTRQLDTHDENTTPRVVEFYRQALENAYGLFARDAKAKGFDDWRIHAVVSQDLDSFALDVLEKLT